MNQPRLLTRNFAIRNQFRAQSRNCQSIRRFSSEQQDFGTHNIILPPEPFVFGVYHIQPRIVPDHIVRPPYALLGNSASPPLEDPLQNNGKIKLGGVEELKIRQVALLAKKVREFASTQVKVCVCSMFERSGKRERIVVPYTDFLIAQVGVTTNIIDAAIHDFIISHSAYPSPLLYSGFPRSCCTRYV